MWQEENSVELNFRFSQCNLFDESATIIDVPLTHRTNNETKQQQLTRPIDTFEETLREIEIYERKLSAFCGLWEDYPRHYYRMEFRIEMGQLVGYSNLHDGKALASYDGKLINMIIIHPKETGRRLDHYRGRLGWNQKYIIWEKEDSSRETGWRSTRKWIKVE